LVKLNFDLHCHSRFSADGVAEPEDIITAAKARGLNGLAITDHNTCACVDYFLQHGQMNAQGTPVNDFLIIPGQEITTREGHLLALGVRLPDLKGIAAAEAVPLIHQAGGLAIPPHPYDLFRAGIRENVLDTLEIDALEVFNAATTLKRYNRQAFEYAQRRGLPMTAASDAHHADAVGIAYTILDVDDFSVAGLLAAIKKGAELQQTYMSPKAAFKKTWNNLFRIRRSRVKTVKRIPVSPP
jgi:predicted metal-dependent phosphoesterase TrpH